MRSLIFLIFLSISSCAYPDIDSVPEFKNVNITNDESIALCEFTITDNKQLLKCIAPHIKEIPNFKKYDFSEKESIELCKLINTDMKKLIECFVAFYEIEDS